MDDMLCDALPDMAGPAPASMARMLPLRFQVAQHLLADIRGQMRSGDGAAEMGMGELRLPTERELARRYGVGLVTVREALRSLEEEGLISRHRRRGTFVNRDALGKRPLELNGRLDSLFEQQSAEEIALLDYAEAEVPAHLAPRWFPVGSQMSIFRRLRRDGGEPTSYAVNYLPVEIGRRVPHDLLAQWPMTRVLRDALGIDIGRVENMVQAGLTDPATVELLDVPLLSPMLFLTGSTYDRAGALIDLAEIEYRADRFRFAVSFDVPGSGSTG